MPCVSIAGASRPAQGLAELSRRERELAPHFAQGQPNKAVAIDFGISERTAEAHRARIYRKLGVRSVLELACRICPHRQL